MTKLQAGDKAPQFKGIIEDETTVQLSDYKGKKLILFFYPKDDTPGCKAEACSLRDNFEALQEAGFELLGVSPDKAAKHGKYIAKYAFPFSLIADTELEVIKAFDIWGPKKFMGKEYIGLHRTTFIIDEKGVISHVITKVKTKAHAEQILELVAA